MNFNSKPTLAMACLGIAVLTLSISPFASADPGRDNGREGDPSGLNQRVERLEHQVDEMRDNIRRLEAMIQNLTPPAPLPPSPVPPPPPVEIVNACMIIDSGYSKAYLGVGSNALDAEYSARNACQNAVNAVYCSGTPKCDNNLNAPYVKRTCLVTDTGYGKTYRGEGRTLVEAEALAKQSCQSDVNSIYCGNAKTTCE